MALADEIKAEVEKIFKTQWTSRGGQVVPEPEDIKLGNEAVEFNRATVLYADLAGSTAMVDTKKWNFSAEIYKTFLYSSARLVRAEGGKSHRMTATGSWVSLSETLNHRAQPGAL